jgi:penicillin V acylase-like amidase (Ntn superfamily)
MKKLLLILLITSLQLPVLACTTFFINKDGQLVFGRNYDWITDAGMVCTNLRGLAKTSMKTTDGTTLSWTSLYGSITFNQYGKEFPTGGMNEKGLVVELMWLDETRYPKPDQRPSVGVLQWIQYQLDNCATIDDVIATDKKLRITSTGTPLHYLVADAKGNAATIEFLDGKMIVHKGGELPLPVLTNSVYSESAKLHKNAVASGGGSYAYGNNSLERFEQACTMVQQFHKSTTNNKPAVDYAFDILGEVAQGSFTKWSIVYDITNRSIRFRTQRFGDVKTIAFSSVELDCTASSKAWDMNQKGNGDIAKKMENFSTEINRRIVETAFKESSSRIDVDEKTRELAWRYAGEIGCIKNSQ